MTVIHSPELETAAPSRPSLVETFMSAGFRPFFLGAAIWAVLAMGLWVASLAGVPVLANPAAWHLHELLFGYLTAAMAGFVLTAAPSWTKQPPLVGWWLMVLFGLWVAARVASLGLGAWPPLAYAALDLSMPVAMAWITAKAVIAGKNWRNASVVVALVLHTIGNAVFHWELAQGLPVAQGVGARLGLAAGLILVSVVGGRIAPNFTRNWLKRSGKAKDGLPPEASTADLVCHAVLGAALLSWIVAPWAVATGVLLIAAGLVHLWRMSRWMGHKTLDDPLMWVLHAGYAFIPLGALALGVSILELIPLWTGDAVHIWTVGAIGLTTLAVMTRATLAHSGGPLVALPGSTILYLALIAAALVRPLFGATLTGQSIAAMGWIVAFGGYAVIYGHRMVKADKA
ncbi:MAG: NnrS family protein [Pseudomonadota bacterium]